MSFLWCPFFGVPFKGNQKHHFGQLPKKRHPKANSVAAVVDVVVMVAAAVVVVMVVAAVVSAIVTC